MSANYCTICKKRRGHSLYSLNCFQSAVFVHILYIAIIITQTRQAAFKIKKGCNHSIYFIMTELIDSFEVERKL